MGSTKSKWRGNQMAFYDGTTFETVKPIAPVVLYDDFLVTIPDTNVWTEVDVGDSTKANALGILQYHLHATNEAEDVGLYFRDSKAFNIDKGLIVEFRAAVHIAPVSPGEMYFGVINDSYGADSMRAFVALELAKFAVMGFYATVGAGLGLCIRTGDGTAVSGIIDTGQTVSLDVFHVYRMDFTTSSAVLFYMDGVQVAGSTTFKMNTAANLMVQPIALATKHDNVAGIGDLYIDYIKVWQATRN